MAKKNDQEAAPAAAAPVSEPASLDPAPAAVAAPAAPADPTVADFGKPIPGLPDAGRPDVAGPLTEIHEPPIDAYTGGLFRRVSGDPEVFALAVMPNARDGRTHFLKNNLHFINVTEEDFRLGFTEVKA